MTFYVMKIEIVAFLVLFFVLKIKILYNIIYPMRKHEKVCEVQLRDIVLQLHKQKCCISNEPMATLCYYDRPVFYSRFLVAN